MLFGVACYYHCTPARVRLLTDALRWRFLQHSECSLFRGQPGSCKGLWPNEIGVFYLFGIWFWLQERTAVKIKICGVTSIEDATCVADAGADFIGFNFFSESPRCLSVDEARDIVAQLPETVMPIGLFVNMPVSQIRSTMIHAGLKGIQLHGDEDPEVVCDLKDYFVIRAFRCSQAGVGPLDLYLRRCKRLNRLPDAVLIDAYVPGLYGGTGQSVSRALLAEGYNYKKWPKLILAGGLDPENVSEAIRLVRPWGVDTASGVEMSDQTDESPKSVRPRKDHLKIQDFVQAARRMQTT